MAGGRLGRSGLGGRRQLGRSGLGGRRQLGRSGLGGRRQLGRSGLGGRRRLRRHGRRSRPAGLASGRRRLGAGAAPRSAGGVSGVRRSAQTGRGSRFGRGRGVRLAPAASSPGSGRSRTTSGATSRRAALTPSCDPRQAKAAVQFSSVSAAQGLWSRTAIRRRRRPSTRTCRVGRTKRRPRTPNQRPTTSSRSSTVHSKRSTSKATSASGSAGVSIRAMASHYPILAGRCCFTENE